MRRGTTDIGQKLRKEESETDRNSLGNLDLLNLRLNIQPEQTEKDAGSGDNRQFADKIKEETGYPRPHQGYDNPKFHSRSESTQTKQHTSSIIANFLLPPKKREEAFASRSTFPLSSAGDAGNFPFKATPSGNLKVNSEQVVFESRKLSVLVANPKHTQLEVYSDDSSHHFVAKKMAYGSGEFTKNSAMDAILSQAGISGISTIIGETPVRTVINGSPEYDSKQTSEILDPELNLHRLGFNGADPIAWSKVALPDKKDLYLELCRRIIKKKNADCKVHIGGEEFNCHLIVLQCYSDLFDGYVAIKKVEIPAEKCSAASFSFIYDWMISEEQSYKYLNRENVLDIFNSAKYLKIKDLIEQCWAFVDNVDVFNEDTAFLLYADAKVKKLEEVRELMVPRIQEFFLILVSTQDWLEMQFDDIKTLLTSNYIRINCEMEVFMAAVRWLKHDWSGRDKYKYALLKCVRFGNIAPWQLVDVKRNPENPEFMELAKDPAVCKLLDDGLAYVIIKYWYGQENEDFSHWNTVLGLTEPTPRNWTGVDKSYFTYREFIIYLDQYRRYKLIQRSKPKEGASDSKMGPPPKPAEQMIPGMEEFLAMKQMMPSQKLPRLKKPILMRKLEKTETVTEFVEEDEVMNVRKMFTPSQNSLALSSLMSFLSPQPKKLLVESTLFLPERETILVFGGIDIFSSYSDAKNAGNNIFRYLPDCNRWEHAGTMPEPRNHHCVGFLKGRIYLAGGTDPRDDDIRGRSRVVDTVWSFDPATRCWFSETSLATKRRNFGLVVIHQHMYVLGGCNEKLVALGTVERFDAKRGVWKFVTSMNYARAGIACAKYRNYIWAAGGTTDLKRNLIVDVVESYDVRADQWTKIKKLNSPRCYSCMFVMSDNLYLIGGTGQNFKDVKSITSVGYVDLWDCSSMSWKTTMELTIPRHGHSVAYIGTQIFIVGGITTTYMRCLSNIECFCARRGAWVRGISELPVTLSGHAAITLPPAMLISNE